uniref:CCHC-type domain-containing protein n=1 Tax=Tanacetum cinerariifolium TaxID=118510 RepID=A0A699GIT7_TANCI|nr:hypothetical protein [Tanacetum cinerariifolium]
MSSPNHPTSNIEDAFFSNFPDYTTASPNYFSASPGNISPDPPDNLSKYLFASLAISPFHNVQAYDVVANKPPIPPQDPITLPTILTPSSVLPPSPLFDPRHFFIPEELVPPKKQIHPSSSSSTTLSNSSRKQACILIPPSFSTYTPTPPQIYELGKISIKIRIPPKRTSIFEAPAMTQAAIRKLVADIVATALETQAATTANTNNPNGNSGLRRTPIARKCTYEKFMSCQPFYFNGMEGAVGLICCYPCEIVSSNRNRNMCQLGFGQQHMGRLRVRVLFRWGEGAQDGLVREMGKRREMLLWHIGNKIRSLILLRGTTNAAKSNYSRGPSEGYFYPVCTTCRRRHLGECRRVAGTCFKCGQTGHLQKDCKKNTAASTSGQADKKPGASGRVFAITEDHATKTSGTIADTLFIYGHVVFVLFDTGATDSVISSVFGSCVTTTPTLLDHVLCISTPMKDSVRVTHVYRDLPLQFDEKIRVINALPLDMCEFDCNAPLCKEDVMS